ncbi:hypothetical protein H7849_23195 [Alloacidobacterium dinghuense]|uniref:Lipoprotein n=1 Tax=Alloacidobacterium dinghuense TaxID=2763107 RepID=A0A7G8BH81_9BACT|nr:hypothetical protein [Alloacidobacterium dinghuense]QNI31901.1 hypothetical protein H7849_23195 [Alloacidobacterium dinghuense]
MKRCVSPFLALALLITSGCRIQVDKSKDGEDKNVKIDTPMGGLHVKTNDMTAADVGLPVYPGAKIVPDHDNDKAADVHLGFGKWQLRVKVVNYQTPDSQDQVLTFYRKSLGRYGDVIECDHNTPVGTPTSTREGLTCGDTNKNVHVDEGDDLSLRAGSKHHQHLVGFKKGGGGNTKFALVELQLPDAVEENDSADSQ